jgi:thioredoxin reductase (NADPH)
VDFSQRPFQLWTELPAGASYETYETGTPEVVAALIAEIKTMPADYTADAVIITTGAVSVMLGVPGEMQFFGRGVSTCAVCDAAFYRDKVTYVVGGGDAAMEDAMALTKFAKSVTVIHRRDSFKASKIMQERVLKNDKVKVLWNSAIKEVKGDQKVTGIVVEQDGQMKELPADGVFVAIGHRPVTDIFKGQIDLDAHGYVINRQSADAAGVKAAQAALTDKDLVAFPTMTSVEGVFVAGDVADIRYKQAITAAGQGCMAALDAERWLEES